MDIKQQSLSLHKKKSGKLEIKSKVPLKNRQDLSLAYTPGVAAVCLAIAQNPKTAYEYTIKKNSVAVVTDGSAVLGLGNIGPLAGLPVMEGKAILFKEFGGVDAYPICLNTQDEEEIIQIVKALAPGFGGINLEDISAPRCFTIEERLKKELDIPVFHDDQHGTAIVVLAGLINSLKLVKKQANKIQAVVSGAGAAGTAITKMLLNYGVKNIIMLDSQGAIYAGRPGLNASKKIMAKKTNPKKIKGGLEQALVQADVFIGVSKGNILKPEWIKTMKAKPIVFAMANPDPEIQPELAKKAGAYIVATGRSDF
ncbi:MAG: malic enzyme-like NAD(P)-binding protein, partial [bacterium]